MDHYLDIRLLPDPEFSPTHLMNALFAKLHRVLAQLANSDIGISFPAAGQTRPGLGTCLRLHGAAPALHKLMTQDWLKGMRDHVEAGGVSVVPAAASHQLVRRIQAKSNPERLRRRQMKRKGWTAEQAREAIPDSAAETLKLPFLTVCSLSTGQNFRLFVDQRAVERSVAGTFNAYGISSSASLPRF